MKSYHLALFYEVKISDEKIFEDAALIVLYHNDILSVNRDKRDGTPNLVLVILKENERSYFVAFREAIKYIDVMY